MDQNHWNQKSSVQEFGIDKNVQQQVVPPLQAQLIRRVSKRNIAIKATQESGVGQIFETYHPQQRNQTLDDIKFIIKCFQGHFVFSSMTETQLTQLANSMFYCKLSVGQTIIRQGDGASSFFILEKGRINVIVDNVPRKEINAGQGFGELALLYNAPRSATCMAVEECYLWGIDRHTFRKSVETIMRSEQEKNRKYLESVKFFNQLTREQKDAVAGVLISQKFNANEIIVNEGDQASSFYIIVEGQCGVFNKEGQQISVLNPSDSFGESALKQEHQVRMMTIKSVQKDTKVLALGKDMIQQILGDQVQAIIYKNICKWALNSSKLFSKTPHSYQDKLLEGVQVKMFTANSKIILKGDKVGQLVILLDTDAVDENKVKFVKGSILFEDSLQDKLSGTTHLKTVSVEADGHVAIVDYEAFRSQQGSVEKIQQGKAQQQEKSSAHEEQIKSQPFKNLIYLNKLGSGQFGSVYLCKFKELDTLFALKYVTRAHIQQFGIQKHIQQEKAVLELMDNPFIFKFYRSYKDNENIYFLTEYIAGMELFDAIRVIGLLSKFDAQFYASQMILQMEYLHTQHSIVYRDIKPENLMVDDQGYLKLIDMGTAKSFKNQQSTKTFTIIGTPHYMAPEVISGKGYGYFADLWSVGVCVYEFICGGLPFGEDAEDPFEIYKEIIKKPISYPHFMTDKSAKPFIEQMMNKIPEVRLGGSYSTLKSHVWFKDYDWEKLLNKSLKAPLLKGKDNVMTSAQIQSAQQKAISVYDQIQKDTQGEKKVLASAKDAEWDSVF
ncbi:unnamed protein product (macronuclear) [Paramecium tetraurelia]|uniref:cGMP-dependent protein kinase n=1 Tax=Paramecium tetraurelia TaxID=5888 RepID=Q3SEP4_PARTE|nr:uncharacterized protein GSPATT00036146001 [Paramecium tetraurelia]CAH69641.1 cGMP-dependent protein kinase 9-4 [Paramecium tetraurelia]CAK67015.1 unnamed protein product [Paramecium tetraurelia]|eukprot:XP_001434412.1 hypothetical protein (macronuclear) [Paramecium tetraurelia strain d4-2]